MRQPASLDTITALLRAECPQLRGVTLTADTPLLSAGLLDSFAIISLVAAIEKALGVELDVAEIPVESFETPATITRLCRDA